MKNNVKKYFQKDKTLPTKEERLKSLWVNSYNFIKNLIEVEVPKYYPQSSINGNGNLWIVKPGGLSRGRNIKIFNNYADIC